MKISTVKEGLWADFVAGCSFFALLLVGYELRTAYIDRLLRGSFGFMYSPWGRCLFLSMYVVKSLLVVLQ